MKTGAPERRFFDCKHRHTRFKDGQETSCADLRLYTTNSEMAPAPPHSRLAGRTREAT